MALNYIESYTLHLVHGITYMYLANSHKKLWPFLNETRKESDINLDYFFISLPPDNMSGAVVKSNCKSYRTPTGFVRWIGTLLIAYILLCFTCES